MKRAQKQRLLSIARALRLLPLLDGLRFLRARRKSANDNERFLAGHPDFDPPPLWWMHDMYRHTSFDLYWRTGRETAAALVRMIDRHLDSGNPRVADWGCGLARVLRHLPDRYRRTGFDYNSAAIRWNMEHIPGVAFLKNELAPPLPAAAQSFDALYALSVFTHLSAEGHEQWMAEIERVLAPGGVFFGAFHMRPAPGQLLPGEQAQFDEGRLVIRGSVKEGSRTYTAYQPERYLREKLFRDFEVLQGPADFFGQTLFAVRKPN
ncbi:MAG: class I SAM-dependent methyltransferase [Pseudomonadota bacterium]